MVRGDWMVRRTGEAGLHGYMRVKGMGGRFMKPDFRSVLGLPG